MKIVNVAVAFVFAGFHTNCNRNVLPQLRALDLAVLSSGSKEIDFCFSAPNRDSSANYWRYRLALVPSNNVPPSGGSVVITRLSDGDKKIYKFHDFENSNWDKHSATSYMLKISSEAFEDGKKYSVNIKFDHSSEDDVRIVLFYLSK